MSRRCGLAVFLTLFPIIVLLGDSIDGFRDHLWGTTKETVISVEGEPDYALDDESGGGIRYTDLVVAQYEAITDFHFDTNDKLVAGQYWINVAHLFEAERYLRDYRDLDRRLERIYGEPTHYEETWISSRGELTGRAVMAGDVRLLTIWEDDNGLVMHLMMDPVAKATGMLPLHQINYFWAGWGSSESILKNWHGGGL